MGNLPSFGQARPDADHGNCILSARGQAVWDECGCAQMDDEAQIEPDW